MVLALCSARVSAVAGETGARGVIYGSVCSGMEAASAAWAPLGWKCAFVSEIDKAPCALLKHRFPDVPNFGDMTKFKDWPDVSIDLLVGGTPCQSFSVAGLRKGLADPRGSLMLTYGAIAQRYRPTWLLWENVPGVLSSNEGRDFGSFLGMLAELGYGFAYRVLDAQFFHLAQRRARVFVVGYLGDWRPPAAVLFERESLRGDPAPSRQAGQGIAGTVAGCSNGGGANGPGRTADDADSLVPLARCVTARNQRIDAESETFVVSHSLRADGFDASEDGTGRGTPLVPVAFSCKDHGADAGDLAPTLRAMGHDGSHANAGGQVAVAHAFDARQTDVLQYGDKTGPLDTDGQSVGVVAFDPRQIHHPANHSNPKAGDPCHPLRAIANAEPAIVSAYAVRRLTPLECLRLQGFPDDYFDGVLYRGKPLADGPKYKMIGNSFAVPVVRWIGERIDLVRAAMKSEAA